MNDKKLGRFSQGSGRFYYSHGSLLIFNNYRTELCRSNTETALKSLVHSYIIHANTSPLIHLFYRLIFSLVETILHWQKHPIPYNNRALSS